MVSSNELIALDVQDAKNDTRSIFTMTLKGDLNPITTGASTDSSALLSRDSQQILYLSNLPEPAIHIKNLGNGKEESVPAKGVLNIQAWSEPLQSIILGKLDKDTGRDLYIYSLKDGKLDGGEMVPFLTDAYNQIHAQISPDGNWIVYASDEINGYQVYLQKFPGLGFKQQISTGLGGIQPQWNPNGNEVFYLAPDRRLMSVAIVDSDSGGKKGETPQPLFRTEVSGPNALHARNNYSVYLDRRGEIRFVVNSVVDSKQPINVIAGWERKPR
jgi:hypothetical protein